MIKSLWRAETGIFLGTWLYLLILGQSQFVVDPGVFWNTVIGQRTLDERRIPRAEEFSCTLPGQPWNSHQWLAQCFMAWLHDRFGKLDTLVLATAVLLAALYTWVARRMIQSGWHWSVALAVVVLGVQASRYHLHARPHIASIVLLGWLFSRLIDCEAGRISLARLFWIPPIIAFWSNLHGGVLGGLATLTLVSAGWCLAALLGLRTPIRGRKDLVCLMLLVLACWLATLVNPYGWELPRDWITLMASPVVPRYIVEHLPLDWRNPYQLPIVFFGLVYLLALANLRSWRQFQVSWLLPLVWLGLSIQRIRHCTLFSITSALALVEVVRYTRAADWLARNDSWIYQPPAEVAQKPEAEAAERRETTSAAWMLIPALVVIMALFLERAGVVVPVLPMLGQGWARLDPEFWPVALLPQLQEYERQHPGAAIFNDMAYGGFLIYHTPGLRIFIDDRCELYGDAFLEEYFQADHALLKAREARGISAAVTLVGNATALSSVEPLALAAVSAATEAHHRRAAANLDFVDPWEKKYNARLEIALVMRRRSGFHYYFENVPQRWRQLGATSGSSDFRPGTALYVRRSERTQAAAGALSQ